MLTRFFFPGGFVVAVIRISIALFLLLAATNSLAQDIEISAFRPESRTLVAGEGARSEVELRNRSRSTRTAWIGYSVQGPAGEWHDVPAQEIALAPRSRAEVALEWPVAAGASGEHRVVMALWNGSPGADGAVRLAMRDQPDAFRVRAPGEPEIVWRAAAHRLGRGRLKPEGVEEAGAGFRLHLAASACDGAEVRTVDRLHYGEYTVRMKTPLAPGSLSAFFLYQDTPGDTSDEIDIEIHNDGSRQILLTTWIAGKQSRDATFRLPFDPAVDFHDYTIRWGGGAVEFLVDGTSIARWTEDFPHNWMRLASNLWWPVWLECAPPAQVRTLEIEAVTILPDDRASQP